MAAYNNTSMSIHQYSKEEVNELVEGSINLQVDESIATQLRVRDNETGKSTP